MVKKFNLLFLLILLQLENRLTLTGDVEESDEHPSESEENLRSLNGSESVLSGTELILPQDTSSNDMLMINAISQLIKDKAFLHNSLYIIYDDETHLDTINGIVKYSPKFKVQVQSFVNLKKQSRKRTNVLFIFRSFESFKENIKRITDELFTFDGRYLILFSEIQSDEIGKMFKILWDKFIYNIGLIVPENDLIVTFQTFLPFNEQNCYDMSPRIINNFDGKNNSWKSKNFFPKKLKNFFNCPVRIGTYEYAPAVIVKTLDNGSYEFSGCDIELLRGLSDALNFTIDLNYLPEYGSWGTFFENGTATGAKRLIKENLTDATIGWAQISYTTSKLTSFTDQYFMIPIIMAVLSHPLRNS